MKTITTLASIALALLLAVPAAAQSEHIDNDTGATNPPRRATSDIHPLPVKPALVWQDTLNITVEDCATGNHPLNEYTDVGFLFTDDGGVFVDDTADATNDTVNDVDPWPAVPAVDDAVYFGAANTFQFVRIVVGTQGSTVMTVLWEYWDGDSWETLTMDQQNVVDFDEAVATYLNHWDVPSDWALTTVDSQSAYWVRARVSAFTSHTTNALLTQIWVGDTTTDAARQLVIRGDTDETEDLWCHPADTAAIDIGQVIDAGTGSKTVEVDKEASEIYCCGDGGPVDVSVTLMNDGA